MLVYDSGALGLLAFALGFAAELLAASDARQSVVRAEQAERRPAPATALRPSTTPIRTGWPGGETASVGPS